MERTNFNNSFTDTFLKENFILSLLGIKKNIIKKTIIVTMLLIFKINSYRLALIINIFLYFNYC